MATFNLPSMNAPAQSNNAGNGRFKEKLTWHNIALSDLPDEYATVVQAILDLEKQKEELRKQVEPVWIEFCRNLPANHPSGLHCPDDKTMRFSYKQGDFGCAVATAGKEKQSYDFKSEMKAPAKRNGK